MDTLISKSELRRKVRAQRASLSAHAQKAAAERLLTNLLRSSLFKTSQRIACYLANDGEIDPQGLITHIWRMKKTCYLPVLSRLSRDRLWFAPYGPGTALVRNRLGILEPVAATRTWVRAQKLDLILLPLVAFDAHGNRLGMGGGFYDRSLAFLRNRQVWHKPHLLGLAHHFQEVASLPVAPWDIPLKAVATDRRLHLMDKPSQGEST